MSHRRSIAAALLSTATAFLLTACSSNSAADAGTAPASPAVHTATTDSATTARQAQFTQIQAQMDQAITTAGLKPDAVVNLHPTGSLTGAKYCLNSLLLQVSNERASQVATSLEHSMKAAGWAPDAAAGAGTVALDHGEWTVTVAHQTSGTDRDPATGQIRTGPMSFFQAKDNSLDCS